MIDIEVFTAKWDKYYNSVINDIAEVLEECNETSSIKTLDIDYEPNAQLLEKHIKELEKQVGIKENPVKAVPLVVIDGHPVLVGVNPEFKSIIKNCIDWHACTAAARMSSSV